jgi:16S rRNA (cytosine967-C5)-methyltransferase
MLAASAQILLLDRVPAHAAVDHAVAWVKSRAHRGASGFINAVLRKVSALVVETLPAPRPGGTAPPEATLARHPGWARDELPLADGRLRRLASPVFAAGPVVRHAQQTSHPQGLLRRWIRSFGEGAAFALCAHDLVQPPIIVAGIAGADAPSLQPHAETGFFVFRGTRDGLESLLASSPAARVQDPGTARALELVCPRAGEPPPRLAIDICAGAGTKTRQLAAMYPQAQIVATDVDPARYALLEQSFSPGAGGRSNIRVAPPRDLAAYVGRADLVLLDVPCSNTGVLARRPEARYRFSLSRVRSLVDLQRRIVRDWAPLVSAAGRLLYATCSLERAENEEQAVWIAEQSGFNLIAESRTWPMGIPGEDAATYRDGGYAALVRRGDSPASAAGGTAAPVAGG